MDRSLCVGPWLWICWCRVFSFKLCGLASAEGCSSLLCTRKDAGDLGYMKRPAQDAQLSQDWEFSGLSQSHGSQSLLSAACCPSPRSGRTLPLRSCQWNHCPVNVLFLPAIVPGVRHVAVLGEMGSFPEDFTVCGSPGSKATATVGQRHTQGAQE